MESIRLTHLECPTSRSRFIRNASRATWEWETWATHPRDALTYAMPRNEQMKKKEVTFMPDSKRPQPPEGPIHLTRRSFLSISLLAGAAALGTPAIAHSAQGQGSPEFKGWPKSYGMLTDFT